MTLLFSIIESAYKAIWKAYIMNLP